MINKEMKPIKDLIDPISIDGETFVPIIRIASLAFNYKESEISHKT
jgi:hypothetical protein